MTLVTSMNRDRLHGVPHEATNMNTGLRHRVPCGAHGPRIPGTQTLLVAGTKQTNRVPLSVDCRKCRVRVDVSLDNADERHASCSKTEHSVALAALCLAFVTQHVETFADIRG